MEQKQPEQPMPCVDGDGPLEHKRHYPKTLLREVSRRSARTQESIEQIIREHSDEFAGLS